MNENKTDKNAKVIHFPNNRLGAGLGCLAPFVPTFDFSGGNYLNIANEDKYTQKEFYDASRQNKNNNQKQDSNNQAWGQDEKSKERLRKLLTQFPGYPYFD